MNSATLNADATSAGMQIFKVQFMGYFIEF